MFKRFAASAILATLAASTFAATPGFYSGIDAGSTKVHDLGNDKSFGGFFGYNINPDFAVEGGYRRLGSWNVSGSDVKVDHAVLSVLENLQLTEQLRIYGRLGYNRIKATARSPGSKGAASVSGSMYGIGVGYDFDGNIGARLEVQKPSRDSTNVGVSVVYSF
jgi:OOP family OmpA-OmpF porin